MRPAGAWQHSCSVPLMELPFNELKSQLVALLGAAHVIDSGDTLETLSKDYYWYSPILKALLEHKSADLAIRPGSIAELRGAIVACWRAKVPITPRGAGTGNYGQAVPIYGGVVVDFSRLDRIYPITDGFFRAEAGARMGTIEAEARRAGYELRCMPSTWMKSSIGGFFCGGSGGIGSITWGGIAAPGNVKSLTIMTCEEEPRILRLEEEANLKALHTYGTTGLVVEVEMRLAPKLDYDQLIFSAASWDRLLDWSDRAARNWAWRKRLVTQFEWPIPSYFKPLVKHFRDGDAVTFILVDRAQADEMIADARAAGVDCVFRRPLTDPPKPPFITDYTWNHTTLWAIKADPSITYLQCGFGKNFREQFAELRRRFPGEILLHLEWTAGNSKMGRDGPDARDPDGVVTGSIPLIFFKSEERLNEILACCAEIGVFVANPHSYVLEEGGRHPNIADKRAFKAEVDPAALLNPGKMKTYPLNPFAPAPATA